MRLILPRTPPRPDAVQTALVAERRFLASVNVHHCSSCGFPAGRTMRGLRTGKGFVPVCPLCHAAADWMLAPGEIPIAALPEVSPPELNRLLHEIYRAMASDDTARSTFAKAAYSHLSSRGAQIAQTLRLGDEPLSIERLREAYWRLDDDTRTRLSGVLSTLRLLPMPKHFPNAYAYWQKHVYTRQPISFGSAA